jgi:hypothetical protein
MCAVHADSSPFSFTDLRYEGIANDISVIHVVEVCSVRHEEGDKEEVCAQCSPLKS